MKVYKIILVVLSICTIGLAGCSDSEKENRIIELTKSINECTDIRAEQDKKIQQLQNSISKLESENKSLNDEIARLKKSESSENSSSTTNAGTKWTGATTISELENKIKGTWWHYIGDGYGIAYKFHFDNNGKVTIYKGSSRDGKWNDSKTFPYKVKQQRMNNGDAFASVQIQDEDETPMKFSGYALNFTDHGMRVILTQFGSKIGQMKYGDYQYKDGI